MTVADRTVELITSELKAGGTNARAVAARSVAAAERLNDTLNAFLQIDRAGAIRRAEELDGEAAEGGPLRGVPVAVKDNICVRGMQATCGSRILAGYHPPYDATVVERLNAAGAVIVGKTNCDEFAMGSSNENSAYGAVRNPWDTERVPGGSSGGSAAAALRRARRCAASPSPSRTTSACAGCRRPAALRYSRGITRLTTRPSSNA